MKARQFWPVKTSLEKPFSALGAWNEVIRYRSDSSLMIEVALPERRVKALQASFGPDLEGLIKDTGAIVNIGTVEQRPGSKEGIRSVLVSGTPEEVAAVDSVFRSRNQRPSTSDGQPAIADRTAVNDTVLASLPPGFLIPSPFLDFAVESYQETPSASLSAWEVVVRDRDRVRIAVELAVPLDRWRGMQIAYGTRLQKLANKHDTTIEVGDLGETVHDGHHCQTVTLSGDYEKTTRAYDTLMQARSLNFNNRITRLEGLKERFLKGHSIVSEVEKPSDTMRPWSRVLRMYNPDKDVALVEMAVPEHVWQDVLNTRWSESKIVDEVDLTCEVGSTFKATPRQVNEDNASPQKDVTLRSLLFSGTIWRVLDVFKDIPQVQSQMRTLREKSSSGQFLSRPDITHSIDQPAPVTSNHPVESARLDDVVPHIEANTANATTDAKFGEPEGSSASVAIVAEDLKTALRPLTHPVVLITSTHNDSASKGPKISRLDLRKCRGVTVSSFSTVAMTPKPMVSFNIKVPSRTWAAIEHSKRFTVHILAATSTAAAMAHVFTQPHDDPATPFRMLREMGAEVYGGEGFNSDRPPYINTQRHDVLAHIHARLSDDIEQSVRIGDHVIVIAEVTGVSIRGIHLLERDESVQGLLQKAVGLAYAKRGYRGMGEELHLPTIPDANDVPKHDTAVAEVAEEEVRSMVEDAEVKGVQHTGVEEHEDAPVQADDEAPMEDAMATSSSEMSSYHDYFSAIADDHEQGPESVRDDHSAPVQDTIENDQSSMDKTTSVGPYTDSTDRVVTEPEETQQSQQQNAERQAPMVEDGEYGSTVENTSSPPPPSQSVAGAEMSSTTEEAQSAPPFAELETLPKRRHLSDEYAWGQPISKKALSAYGKSVA